MEYSVQDLRDLLALARMLRRFARDHDDHQCLFLETASVLEARAFFIANSDHHTTPEQAPGRDPKRHAPVDVLI